MQTQLTVKQRRFCRGQVAATALPGTAAHKHRHPCPWLRVFTRCSWRDPPALTQLFFPLAKQAHWEMIDRSLWVRRFQMQTLTCPWISHATLASYLGAGGRGTHKAGSRKRGEKGSGKQYLNTTSYCLQKKKKARISLRGLQLTSLNALLEYFVLTCKMETSALPYHTDARVNMKEG